MRRILLTFAAFAAFFQLATAQEYLPKWQEGYMDIHTIATGRGDATFIVMPDGTTLMIDAGDNGKIKDPQHPDTTKRAGEKMNFSPVYLHITCKADDKDFFPTNGALLICSAYSLFSFNS